jgi:hypothetical protein
MKLIEIGIKKTVEIQTSLNIRNLQYTSLLLIFLTLTSCAHGPQTEKKSPLNYLSGEHYAPEGDIAGIPVTRRKPVDTTISGTLMVDSHPIPIPLKFQALSLKQGDNTLLKTSSAGNGTFSFKGIIPNGTYSIELASKKYNATVPVTVTDYHVENLIFLVK